MTDGIAQAEPEIERERGWGRVVVGVVLFIVMPMTPVLRVLLPVDETLVLLAPLLASGALVGWWVGGRLSLAALWTGLAGWILWQFTSGRGTFALLVCGWAVLLAATFGALSLVERRAAVAARLFPRAMGAIGLALVLATGVAALVPPGFPAMRESVRTEVYRRADEAVQSWRQTTSTPEWTTLAADNSWAGDMARQLEQQLKGTPEVALALFPSLLALQSLGALALAWAMYHRVGRARLGPPLAPLRDFRFSDQFVWGLIAGLVMVVVPGLGALSTFGANLLVFFGVVYALRGMGVLLWFLAPGRLVMALLVTFAVLFWHVLGVFALGLGLGDTWLDWRARARQNAHKS